MMTVCYLAFMTFRSCFYTRAVNVVLLAVALVFSAAATSHASFVFTSPSKNSLIKPDSQLMVTFNASCPADKKCGSWNGSFVNSQVEIDLIHATLTEGYYGDAWVQLDPALGVATLNVNEEYITAGSWKLYVKWAECPKKENPSDPVVASECTISEISHPLSVRAQVGVKGTVPYLSLQVNKKRKRSLKADVWFLCNAPIENYRANVLLQKQVRKGKRLVWVAMGKAINNVRAVKDPESNIPRCIQKNYFSVPRSIKAKDKLRAKWVIATVGFKPAAPKTVLYSNASSYGSILSSGGGGGIVIGS